MIDGDKSKGKPAAGDTQVGKKKKKNAKSNGGAKKGGEPSCAPDEMAAEPELSEHQSDPEEMAAEPSGSKPAVPKAKAKAKSKSKASKKSSPVLAAAAEVPAEESKGTESAAPKGRRGKAKAAAKAVATDGEDMFSAEELQETESAAPTQAKPDKRKSPDKPNVVNADTSVKRKSPNKPDVVNADTSVKRKSPVKPNDKPEQNPVPPAKKRAKRVERTGDCKVLTTFARRYMPEKAGFSRERWHAIRIAFNTNVHKRFECPSKHEDGVYRGLRIGSNCRLYTDRQFGNFAFRLRLELSCDRSLLAGFVLEVLRKRLGDQGLGSSGGEFATAGLGQLDRLPGEGRGGQGRARLDSARLRWSGWPSEPKDFRECAMTWLGFLSVKRWLTMRTVCYLDVQ